MGEYGEMIWSRERQFADLQLSEIEDLYKKVGALYHTEWRTYRDQYKAIGSVIDTWGIGYPQNHPRSVLRAKLWDWVKTSYKTEFANMNSVSSVRWPAMYKGRVEAWRETFMVFAAQNHWGSAAKHFKRRPLFEPIPPGVHQVSISECRIEDGIMFTEYVNSDGRTVCHKNIMYDPRRMQIVGKRADLIVMDDIGEPGLLNIDWESWKSAFPQVAGTVTGRWSSRDVWMDQEQRKVIAMIKGLRTARVVFKGTQQRYDYMTTDATLKEDDYVVVDTSTNGISIAKVVEMLDGGTSNATKWVVQRVDRTEYDARLEKMQQAAVLRRQLDAEVKRAQSMIDYEAIASKDEGVREALEKLRALDL